jgi:serine protease
MTKLTPTRMLCLGALLAGTAGCTVNQSDIPSITGPSEYALSVGVTATPDTLTQDGGSTSSINVSAFGPNGEPKPGVTFRLDLFADSTDLIDAGTLSAKTLVTGSNGQASALYTAPRSVAGDASTCNSLPGGCVTITATPVGTNYYANSSRAVQIHLVPGTIIQPSGGLTPLASFSFSPNPAVVAAQVAFNAGGSVASAGHYLTGYQWDWGDGDPVRTYVASTEQHDYLAAGSYMVTLTVYDEIGQQTSFSRVVKVNAAAAPAP